MQRIHCFIRGKVQMVNFRHFVQQKARSLALVGWVRNIENGSLEVVAQGEEANLNKLIEYLHKGPFLARVMRVDVEWQESKNDLSGFAILF